MEVLLGFSKYCVGVAGNGFEMGDGAFGHTSKRAQRLNKEDAKHECALRCTKESLSNKIATNIDVASSRAELAFAQNCRFFYVAPQRESVVPERCLSGTTRESALSGTNCVE